MGNQPNHSDDRMPPKLKPDDETIRLNLAVPASLMKKVDEWRRHEPEIPGRSEAIRQLLEAALEASKKRGKPKD